MKTKIFTLLFAVLAGIGTMNAEIHSGTCGAYLTWNLAGSTLTISGTGTMDNYTVLGYYSTAPWREYVESIEVVVVDAGVTHIGNYAFYWNPNLKEVHLGNTLEIIGASAFAGCSSLTTINFPNSLTTIYDGAFTNCGMQSISLPNTITYLGNDAFAVCKELVSANIPNKLTAISDRLFSGCSKLASIEIPDGVTSIGMTAFQGCTSLTSVVIPNSVTIIGNYAFNNCSGLISVTIGTGVETIKEDAFTSCSGLKGVYISDLAAWCSINHEWYNGNTILLEAHNLYLNGNLVTNLVIPNGVKRIKARAFDGCSSITSVSLPASVDTLELWAFAHCDNLASISMSNIKLIGEQAFAFNPSLTSVEIPGSVKSIGWGAFRQCTALKKVTLNKGLEEIMGDAFSSTALEELTIPETVQHIGDYVLGNGTNMHYIACAATIPPVCGDNAFTGVDKSIPLYVPEASIEVYKEANQWKEFLDIRPLVDIFHVTFVSWDGAQLKAEYVESGKAATAPNAPEREDYIFTGWDKDFTNVTEDMTVTAQYRINRFEVLFLDWNEVVLKKDSVKGGNAATAPDDPTREGYTFIGWDKDFSNVTEDMAVTAQYKINRYNVQFLDWNGAILKKDSLNHGETATAPADPTREGYTFIGWDKEFSNITQNLIITAQYELGENKDFTINFNTQEGEEIISNAVILKVPAAPTINGFTFIGWRPIATIIEGNTIEIEAVYEADEPSSAPAEVNVPGDKALKLIRQGNVYILRGEKIYTITGQEVR